MKTFNYQKEVPHTDFLNQKLIEFSSEYLSFSMVGSDNLTLSFSDSFDDEAGLNTFMDSYVDNITDDFHASEYNYKQNLRRFNFDVLMSKVIKTIALNESITIEQAQSKSVSIMYEANFMRNIEIWYYSGYIVPDGEVEMPLVSFLESSNKSWLDYMAWDVNETLRNEIVRVIKEN
jgi:hypothetical protein